LRGFREIPWISVVDLLLLTTELHGNSRKRTRPMRGARGPSHTLRAGEDFPTDLHRSAQIREEEKNTGLKQQGEGLSLSYLCRSV
jgi:hypothetical protein